MPHNNPKREGIEFLFEVLNTPQDAGNFVKLTVIYPVEVLL